MINTVKDSILNLVNSAETELNSNILKFWTDHAVDNENGGFYGYISNELVINKTHHKASVLNARILWTFSTAYRFYRDDKYLRMAERAYAYIVKYFIDKINSGVYWMLDYKGNVIDSKNQTYSIAFMIYGFSEFYRATGRTESLDLAIQLYRSIEAHAYDKDNEGYIEAMSNNWQPLSDMSLSPKDMNVCKSMNTHLHVMEAYTNLLRVWDNEELKNSLEKLVNVTIRYIIDPHTYQFKLFFDGCWTSLSEISSFGHDIEGSWLLYESAEVLGNEELLKKVRGISVRMAEKVLERGIDKKNGGLFYEEENGILTQDKKEWWPQAETVVGFLNAYQLTDNVNFFNEAIKTWDFISNHIIDKKHGEWFWGTVADGSSVTDIQKAGPWKCPYHNSRMCFEILTRFKSKRNIMLFEERLKFLTDTHNELINRKNPEQPSINGIYSRYRYPVITKEHTPLFWRYDFDKERNPYLMERIGINCAFNPGAIEFNGKICLMVRVEGNDRKSFFAVAESDNGIDNFKFWDYPVLMPETEAPDINVYDMRLVKHEDGFIYGLFCTERKDPDAPFGDTSSAIAACGIARTKNLKTWERLPDLKSASPQQRNVVLHPEFINGKYALYTRPQDGFIETGKGGGIGFAYTDSMENACISEELLMECKEYHTIKEVKNGQGPAPIKTDKGWLHIAHGVRNTAAGLRYVVYAFLSELKQPEKVTHRPGGFLIVPEGEERIGDVSNVVFCNGVVAKANGDVFIYYASSDTRCHVATTTKDKLLDYVLNTPEDPLRSYACVQQRISMISKNLELIKNNNI